MKNLFQSVLSFFAKREKTELELLTIGARKIAADIERSHKGKSS